MAALEPMYRDYAKGKALRSPRMDNIAPSPHPDAYYAFKHMGGTWPARKVQALRINSDVITHPVIAGQPRRVKQPLADGRWVGLVLLFSTETGQLLAVYQHASLGRGLERQRKPAQQVDAAVFVAQDRHRAMRRHFQGDARGTPVGQLDILEQQWQGHVSPGRRKWPTR